MDEGKHQQYQHNNYYKQQPSETSRYSTNNSVGGVLSSIHSFLPNSSIINTCNVSSLTPCPKAKLKEVFLKFLSDPLEQQVLLNGALYIQSKGYACPEEEMHIIDPRIVTEKKKETNHLLKSEISEEDVRFNKKQIPSSKLSLNTTTTTSSSASGDRVNKTISQVNNYRSVVKDENGDELNNIPTSMFHLNSNSPHSPPLSPNHLNRKDHDLENVKSKNSHSHQKSKDDTSSDDVHSITKQTNKLLDHKRIDDDGKSESSPSSTPKISKSKSDQRMRKSEVKGATYEQIPKFYFPFGSKNPKGLECVIGGHQLNGRIWKNVFEIFEKLSTRTKEKETDPVVNETNIGEVVIATGFPFYWKSAFYNACQIEQERIITGDGIISKKPENVQSISFELYKRVVEKIACRYHESSSRFIHFLTYGDDERNYLIPSDFKYLVQDLIDNHPSLTFLQNAADFHDRYITTVTSRIFFEVNISWNGRISVGELRRSNLLKMVSLLEHVSEVNLINDYFSYEHFYVIYCKFWELDQDHDLHVTKEELRRHSRESISDCVIDRLFTGVVSTNPSTIKNGRMSYEEFVWFLIAEEDKLNKRSIEYWFRVMDLDGDGIISIYEMEHFYTEIIDRLTRLGYEYATFTDAVCQMLDMVNPTTTNQVKLHDLKRCQLANLFFDTFINYQKLANNDNRDPYGPGKPFDEDRTMTLSIKELPIIESEDENLVKLSEYLTKREKSEWDRYAYEEYQMLVAEDGGTGNESGNDDSTNDDSMDVDDQLHSNEYGSLNEIDRNNFLNNMNDEQLNGNNNGSNNDFLINDQFD
ncbi:hypothetical protein SNEBB_005030 [Seison nebaliae]|nr:hypothetical protein SNEBB_005030 [Seison nebaliae]